MGRVRKEGKQEMKTYLDPISSPRPASLSLSLPYLEGGSLGGG